MLPRTSLFASKNVRNALNTLKCGEVFFRESFEGASFPLASPVDGSPIVSREERVQSH